MGSNNFVKLFGRYGWIVEEYGENNFIAYNDTYFVPFSCVPFEYDNADTICCVSYLLCDKEKFVDLWEKYNHKEGIHTKCKMGHFAFMMYSENNIEIERLCHFGGLANDDHDMSEVDQWLYELVKCKKFIKNDDIAKYYPDKYGCIIAIRIYLINDHIPMADLVFPDGKYTTIEWINISHRNKYKSGINGYTLVYDERPKRDFKEWIL